MPDNPNVPSFETDDKNLAALLRAKDVRQTGRRSDPLGNPERPHLYFQFEDIEDQCGKIKELALLGGVNVNYRRFITEQNAILDQIFEHRRRITEEGELPPFLARRYKHG